MSNLSHQFLETRNQTTSICAPLLIEDYVPQASEFTSPPKWHLAHTSWFFEELILKLYAGSYEPYDATFSHLFNSYYESLGGLFTRAERGLLTRPTVQQVYAYRAHVDEAMVVLLKDTSHTDRHEIEHRCILGLNHEQQHQELLLMDIKHAFSKNPLRPVYCELLEYPASKRTPQSWITFDAGLYETGHKGDDFAYDNEMPRHKSYSDGFRIATRPVSNQEYILFIDNGGYEDADLWLSDGWATVQESAWKAPLYWEKTGDEWQCMTLHGMQRVDKNAPACHLSFYEAAAYARWAKKRLPTEVEWEIAAQTLAIEGNLGYSANLEPLVCQPNNISHQFYGDVWEWTSSPYTEYPGYQRLEGPFGEYNGKFMSSQMVLRGGSCLTPRNHIRSSYRNFFYPHCRWQYSGLRLAEDIT